MEGAFCMAAFALAVYIVVTMPTKKDIRKLVGHSETTAAELRSMLRAHIGQTCDLILSDADSVVGGTRLSGIVRDVDDEWVLVECVPKPGKQQLRVLRLELVEGIERRRDAVRRPSSGNRI